jgi:hypothetical protein
MDKRPFLTPNSVETLVMNLPRARFTMRRMMVAIALLGSSFGVLATIERRRASFERLGWYHRDQVISVLAGFPGADGNYLYEPTDVDQQGNTVSDHQREIDRWHESLAQKYWTAARYPWLPVSPDPSAPD